MIIRWCIWLAFVAASQSSGTELISVGVGVVKGRVCTSREVQILHLLEVALYQKNAKEPAKTLALDSKLFHQAAQEALIETVVGLEGQGFTVIEVTVEELHDASQKALKALSGKAWQGLEVSKEELETYLKRKMLAKKFVNFRAQSSVLPVTDSDALTYFNENQVKFNNLPFENFKDEIKSYLSRTQVERRLKDWYDVLMSKYQVRNLIAEM